MKKFLSLALTAIMLVGLFALPVYAAEPMYSSDKAKDLVAEMSGIDAGKLNANLGQRYDAPGQAWNIYYGDQDINVSATIDASTGEIINYGYNMNYYPAGKRDNVPNYTRDELKETALDFVKKFAPDKYDQIDKDPDFQYGNYNYNNGPTNYAYHFKRNMEQLSTLSQGVDISVDATSGKVTNYYINWTDISKVDTKGLLTEDEALKKLDGIMGTFLVQQQIWKDNMPPEKKLLYAPTNNAGVYPLPMGINAKTGEPVNYNGQIFESGKREEYKVSNVNKISPLGKMDEKKAKGFAEDYLRSLGKDPAKFALNINVSNNYNNGNKNVYNIYGNYGDKDGNSNINAVIEEDTGKIISLNYGEWANQPASSDASKGIEIEKAMEIAKDYISKIKLPFGNMLVVSGKDYNYTVNFMMYEDGVLYPMNTVNVNIDNEGNVIGFNINYGDTEKADTAGIITMDDAKAKLSEYQKLQLSFVLPRDQYSGNPTGDPIPVYQLSYMNGFGIDAKTGEFVGYDKSPIPAPGEKFDPYTGIKGDKNEKVLKIFVDTGIMPQPIPPINKTATVGQAALVLSKVFIPDYYTKPMMEGQTDANPEDLAIGTLKEYGIIKENVKSADQVTKAQIALWLSRAVGYDRLINSDIGFTSPVKDIDGLDKEVKNSIAIVTSLKVMDAKNGEFKPNDTLIFSDFCNIVYNAMKNM